MDVSFCFSNSEVFCQEEIFLLNPIEKKTDIYVEAHKENQFVNSEIFNEVEDVPLGNCHEFSLHGSF